MLVLAVAVGVALLLPLITRGSYSRLLAVEWHWSGLLFCGLGIQIFLEFYSLPRARWHDVGFGLLVASYVLILAFVARNYVLRGMGVVFVGIACNALVIVLNQGMPVRIPADWQRESWAQAAVKHHPQQPDDRLRVMTDIIVVREPFDAVLSFGDLILAVGLCDVAFHASRRPKPRRARALSAGDGGGAAEPEPEPVPLSPAQDEPNLPLAPIARK
ncbi:MAG TPA: DUF5317 family protein [Acidimicrobiia bacterium]|nr:DUF5317 family protein [Acidimicrobiia bacterium]